MPIPAATVVAGTALFTEIVIVLRYWRSAELRVLWKPLLGIILGIPIGLQALAKLDASVVLVSLGIFLIIYSIYSFISPRIPTIQNSQIEFGLGFISGLLGGAFNTSGPPLVVYGLSKRWQPIVYKANLQVLLMANTIFVIVLRFYSGHFTPQVLRYIMIALPMVGLGVTSGLWLGRYINPILFRRVVLILLMVVGVRMVFVN